MHHTNFLGPCVSLALVLAGGCTSDGNGRDSSNSGGGILSLSDSNGNNETGDGDGDGMGGGDTAGSATSGNSGNSADSDDNDDSGGADGNTKFDLGIQPDSNYMPEDGCTKVDFLFIIDNSGSMAGEQANLINSFPGFISAIQSTLENVDEYQVGVVTTDSYSPNNAVPGCNVLGGLVTRTGGDDSSSSTCGPYAAGRNYMTEIDNLDTTFSCAARVGTDGSAIERPMDALINVVSRAHGGPGQCNEGFLRDDALLVAVIISDEWDGPNDPDGAGSNGSPQDWYDAVVAAKLGIPENAVVVSLINYAGGNCPPNDSTADGEHIATFTNMFLENGFLGGICEPNYGPIFTEAVGVIEQACNNFQPPG